MCTCQECLSRFKADFLVPRRVWARVRPKHKKGAAGLLCGVCVAHKLEQLFGYSAWKVTKIS